MFEGKSEQISTRMGRKLDELRKSKRIYPQYIFKVHQALRRENEQAYEPEMIAIGPYHHGKNNLEKMEKYKLRFVQELLDRRDEKKVKRYIEALINLEGIARNCYAEEINLSTEAFVEMMFLDGCFIIELIRKYNASHTTEAGTNNTISSLEWFWGDLKRDLLLFENQLPFFVLSELFELSKYPYEADLISQAISYLNDCSFTSHYTRDDIEYREDSIDELPRESSPHLLGLMHKMFCRPSKNRKIADEYRKDSDDGFLRESFRRLLGLMHEMFCSLFSKNLKKSDQEYICHLEFIRSATELEISGVKLRKAENEKEISWLDISFENGELRIPPLLVQDQTESILRNLIAYEEYTYAPDMDRKFITDYVTFMDCLINTAEDVKKLRHNGVVKNWLGNDEAIAIMFNKIAKNVTIDSSKFCYAKVFNDINKYCKKRRNTWMAHLKENYFGTPWSIISFLAAFALLVLTFLQTVFAILH